MRGIHRNLTVDRLRGIAIILVIGLHFFGLWNYVCAKYSVPYGVYKIFSHGYLGVNMFFAISGYLIGSTSVAREKEGLIRIEASAFYVRRATRILPLLILTLAIGAIAVAVAPLGLPREYLFDMPGTVFSAGFWASTVCFGFNWFRLVITGPNGAHGWFGLQWDVLWSLAVEEQFYILFPFAIMASRTVARLRTTLWVVFSIAVITRVLLTASGADWITSATNSVSCFDALSLGVLAALSDPWSPRASRIAAGLGCLSIPTFYVLGYAGWGLSATGMAGATALIIQSSKTPGTFPQIPCPAIEKLGMLSYGLYLLQALAFSLLPSPVFQVDPFIGFVIALGIATLMAWFSFSLFERPVERILRRCVFEWLVARRATVHAGA